MATSLYEGKPVTLVFGAAGAIGKQLVAALTEKHGPGTVVAALRRTPLPQRLTESPDGTALVASEMGVDLRDGESVAKVVLKYSHRLQAIWNLAAPLSVETEADPASAEDTVVGGMQRLIDAMEAAQLSSETRLLYSDSIGSFGGGAPRENATASWLVENPEQDPGSDYGRQKRRCRELLRSSRFDTRWAVIPGVLHDDPAWGDGTTEYALAAMLACFEESPYVCPVRETTRLPMIHTSDLIAGMMALQAADPTALEEPENGYALAGFSFTPAELEASLRRAMKQRGLEAESAYRGDVEWKMVYEPIGAAAVFAEIWPNSISGEAALRDLSWSASTSPNLDGTVNRILAAHAERRCSSENPSS